MTANNNTMTVDGNRLGETGTIRAYEKVREDAKMSQGFLKISVAAICLSLGAGHHAIAAGSASAAVDNMTANSTLSKDERRKLLRDAKARLDTNSTGSITSANQYDARGVVKPKAEVTLGAGIAAKIDALPYKDGERFKEGDMLVSFDCARQRADLRGANAGLQKTTSLYKNKQRLKKRGAAGAQEVSDAESDVLASKANVDSLQEVVRMCSIHAPFEGRVVERHASQFEIPAANAPIITVVDDSALELDLIVPSRWLRWVSQGSEFEFDVDELGRSYKARIVRLGAKVDAVSQTIKLTGTFVARPDNVLAGMSGTAKFSPPTN